MPKTIQIFLILFSLKNVNVGTNKKIGGEQKQHKLRLRKGRCDEFETNVQGPMASHVEFSNILHKICQKAEILTVHFM